jgi:hypothetical protein
MQKKKNNDNNRKKEEELRRLKQIMLEKFDKVKHKPNYDKEEFYKEIFTSNMLGILSK